MLGPAQTRERQAVPLGGGGRGGRVPGLPAVPALPVTAAGGLHRPRAGLPGRACATTIAGRLVEQLGTPVPGLGPLGLSHTFPSAETLAGADLSGMGLTPARAEAIGAFAEAVADDAVRLDRSVGLDDFVSAVTSISGLGSWTAHYLALRMGEPDAFPATDLGLRRALEHLAPESTAPLAEQAERWRPWRALAAIHLWTAPTKPPALPRQACTDESPPADRTTRGTRSKPRAMVG